MKLTIGDLRNLIPDILDLRDERRLLESELERHLIEDAGTKTAEEIIAFIQSDNQKDE